MVGRRVDVGLMLFTGEGLRPGHVDPGVSLVELGILAEQVGFGSVGVIDHLYWDLDDGPHGFWEGTSIVAALAAATSQIRIVTSVVSSPFRNPALVAKTAETIDMISNGRFVLGLGAGGGPPEEYESFGVPNDHRYARFVEAVEIIHRLLHDGHCDYDGVYYQTKDCVLRPRGPRPTGPPIAIGASGPKMMQLAARYGDEWNGFSLKTPTVELFAPVIDQVDAACRAAGRDPSTLRRTIDIDAAPTGDPGLPSLGTPMHGTPTEIAGQLAAFSDIGIAEVRLYLWPQDTETVTAMAPVLEALDSNP